MVAYYHGVQRSIACCHQDLIAPVQEWLEQISLSNYALQCVAVSNYRFLCTTINCSLRISIYTFIHEIWQFRLWVKSSASSLSSLGIAFIIIKHEYHESRIAQLLIPIVVKWYSFLSNCGAAQTVRNSSAETTIVTPTPVTACLCAVWLSLKRN